MNTQDTQPGCPKWRVIRSKTETAVLDRLANIAVLARPEDAPALESIIASNTALREALRKLIHYADGEMTHMEAEIALENAISAARAALSQSEEAK